MTSKIVQMDWIVEQKRRDGIELTDEDRDLEFKVSIAKSLRGLYARDCEKQTAILDLNKRLDRLSEVLIKHA